MSVECKGFVAALAVLLLVAAPARAAAPVAVVEDVQGAVPGVEFMDYVAAGRVIRLGAKDVLVLGYMHSCWRETITGGTVTVGLEQSQVQQGKVERAKVACGAPGPQLGAGAPVQGAATVFRSLNPNAAAQVSARFTLFGSMPVVDLGSQRGVLVIERRDRAAERVELVIEGPALQRGRFLDLAVAGVALAPGGLYTARAGALSVDFKVAGSAEPGATPLVGRLLRFD